MAIFIDLDGVMVNNEPMIRTQYEGFLKKYDVPVDWTLFSVEDWANAPKSEWADDLIKFLKCFNTQLCFLSESISPEASMGKHLWIKKHYPDIDFELCSTKRFNSGFLIDDKEGQEFSGIHILYPAFHNKRKGMTKDNFFRALSQAISPYISRSTKTNGHWIPNV